MWWEGGKQRRESSSLLPSDHPLLPQCALGAKTTGDESGAGTNYPGGQSRPNRPVSLVQYCNCLIGWQNWSSGDSQKRSFEEILVSNQGQTRNRLDQDKVARLGETAVFWAGCAFVSCQDSRPDSIWTAIARPVLEEILQYSGWKRNSYEIYQWCETSTWLRSIEWKVSLKP